MQASTGKDQIFTFIPKTYGANIQIIFPPLRMHKTQNEANEIPLKGEWGPETRGASAKE